MSFWIGLLSGLAGVVVGGILNHFTTKANFLRQTQWERDKILQQKLEEIAQVTEEIAFTYGKIMIGAINAISFRAELKIESEVVPFARLRMLVSFYAPELANHVHLITDAQNKFSEPLLKALDGRVREQPERQQINGDLVRIEGQMSRACNGLSEAAADLGRRLFKISC